MRPRSTSGQASGRTSARLQHPLRLCERGACLAAAGRGYSRTPRQQEQNKQAQQRYRERRKMKVVTMESQLTTAQQQVLDLQNVLKQNVALQVRSWLC